MRVDLIEMLTQSTNLDDRSHPPGDRLIRVVSYLSSYLKSTQQNIPRSCVVLCSSVIDQRLARYTTGVSCAPQRVHSLA